jgi:hypothetical protein
MNLRDDQIMEQQAVELCEFWKSMITSCVLTHYRYEFWLRRLGMGECREVIKAVDRKVKECPDIQPNQIFAFAENCFSRRKTQK